MSADNTSYRVSPYGSGQDYQKFLLTTESIKEKSSKDYGLSVMRYVASTCAFNTGSYYYARNARFIKNRNYANGRIDVQQMFQDRFLFNSKPNYIALNWNTLQIVNRIVSGLVSRWMKRGEKIQVKAIDDLSQKDKKEEYQQYEFFIEQREKIEQLQQASGVPILPNEDLPADKEALNIWRSEIQRLPEEISQEMITNDVLSSNGWFDVQKEKILHDSAETFLVGSYVWMDNQGVIHVRPVKPEDAIYSYSENNDMRDLSWKGEAPSVTISQIRRQWGKEFNPDNPFALTEQEIWERVVPTAKEWKLFTNITWNDYWASAFLRPYDEWSVRSIQVEVKTVDSENYTVTKTKGTGSTYVDKGLPKTQSGKVRQKPSENQNIIGDTNWNIYRGVYLPDSNTLLEWGLKTNMIRPQDPREIGNAEFSYSFVMPQNYLARNLAIPEKIEAAVDGMMLALLKMQQVVARMRPTGAAIDESALQNIDYGLGDAGNKQIDYKKLYDQTGDIYYRGLDAEGNRVPVPIVELQNSGFLAQMDGLIKNYQFWYQTLKDELGEDPNLITAAIQPRVTADNVEVSQEQADNATDKYYRAYAELTKQTARKISCLIQDSIKYESSAYRHIANKDDLDGRIFTTDIRFLPTDMDVQQFEVMMNQVILANPEILQFIDPFQLTQTAKENYKLANMMFRQGQKKMILWQAQIQQQNQQATIQGQIQSAQAAEEAKRETMAQETEMKSQVEMAGAKERQKEALINGFMGALGRGVPVPAEWKQVETELIKNIAIPLFAQNISQEAALSNAINQATQPEGSDEQQQPMQQQDLSQQQNIQQPAAPVAA